MAGKNEYTVFDYLQWRGDLTLQQDPFNEVDNLVLCIIAYINLRKIDRLWSKNPKDAMPIGDVCARLTAADEQLGLSSLDYIPVMRAAAETERFRDTRLFAFESRNDEAKQMQFPPCPSCCRTAACSSPIGGRIPVWWAGRRTST